MGVQVSGKVAIRLKLPGDAGVDLASRSIGRG